MLRSILNPKSILFLVIFLGVFLGFLMFSPIQLNRRLNPSANLQALADATRLQEELQKQYSQIQSVQKKSELQEQMALLDAQRLELETAIARSSQKPQYLSENNSIWTSGAIVLGSNELAIAILVFPEEMILGDSGIVSLSLIPSSILETAVKRSTGAVNSEESLTPFQLTDQIQIYPIMQAELTGIGFDISSTEKEQRIAASKITEWIWSIKPKEAGKQILVLDISVPGILLGQEKTLPASINLFPIELNVKRAFSNRFNELLPYLIPAFLGLLGVLFPIIAGLRRRAKQKDFKKGGKAKTAPSKLRQSQKEHADRGSSRSAAEHPREARGERDDPDHK